MSLLLICYIFVYAFTLAALQSILGYYRGYSLTHLNHWIYSNIEPDLPDLNHCVYSNIQPDLPDLNHCVYSNIDLNITGKPHNKHPVRFELATFRFWFIWKFLLVKGGRRGGWVAILYWGFSGKSSWCSIRKKYWCVCRSFGKKHVIQNNYLKKIWDYCYCNSFNSVDSYNNCTNYSCKY